MVKVPDSPAGLEGMKGRGIPERSASDRAKRPWQVAGVFDSKGVEPDFAYTVGLHTSFGHPELVVWGAPEAADADTAAALAEDVSKGLPAWQMRSGDLGELLNEVGERIRSGEVLGLGDTWTSPVDGDGSFLTLTTCSPMDLPLGEPVTGQLTSSTPVMGLALALSRPARGERSVLTNSQRVRYQQVLTGFIHDLRRHDVDLAGFDLDGIDPHDLAEEGLDAAMLRAIMALAKDHNADGWSGLLSILMEPQLLRSDLGVLVALARRKGRDIEVNDVLDAIGAEVVAVADREGLQQEQRQIFVPTVREGLHGGALALLLSPWLSDEDLLAKTGVMREGLLPLSAQDPRSCPWLPASPVLPDTRSMEIERITSAIWEVIPEMSTKSLERLERSFGKMDIRRFLQVTGMAKLRVLRAGHPGLWVEIPEPVRNFIDALAPQQAEALYIALHGALIAESAKVLDDLPDEWSDILRNPLRSARLALPE